MHTDKVLGSSVVVMVFWRANKSKQASLFLFGWAAEQRGELVPAPAILDELTSRLRGRDACLARELQARRQRQMNGPAGVGTVGFKP